MSDKKFSHRELCEIGAKFLRRPESSNGHGCHFVVIEPACYGENADVFGVRHGRDGFNVGTVLLEAKTSRSDFLIDRKKPHRAEPSTGIGKWRYYICPTDLIKPDELPDKWGLVYINGRGHCKIIVGAMAVPKERHQSSWHPSVSYWRNGTLLQESFIKYAFDERNEQNEMNILTMALSRLNNAEDMLYMQREFNNTRQKNVLLNEKIRLLESKYVHKYGVTDEFMAQLQKVEADLKNIQGP